MYLSLTTPLLRALGIGKVPWARQSAYAEVGGFVSKCSHQNTGLSYEKKRKTEGSTPQDSSWRQRQDQGQLEILVNQYGISGDLPGSLAAKTLFPMQGVWVWSLVGELRSHKPLSEAKKGGISGWAKSHTVLIIIHPLLRGTEIIKYSDILFAFLLACYNIQRGNCHDFHQEKAWIWIRLGHFKEGVERQPKGDHYYYMILIHCKPKVIYLKRETTCKCCNGTPMIHL